MTATPKPCPFCGSTATIKDADFGTALMVNRQYCRACKSFFEAIKWGDTAEELDLPSFLRRGPSPNSPLP
jgi:hypothetical protein